MRTAPGGLNSRCSRVTRTTGCATRPPTRSASTSFLRRGWIRSRRRSRATSLPTTSTGRADNYFVSGPFTFDRQQVDSKVDYSVNYKFNLAGTFGVLHYRTNVPTVFGDDGVGRADRRKQQPGARSRQHVPADGHGDLHLQPHVPDGRSLRMGAAGDRIGAAGSRHEHRVGRAGDSGDQRHARVRERLADVRFREATTSRRSG